MASEQHNQLSSQHPTWFAVDDGGTVERPNEQGSMLQRAKIARLKALQARRTPTTTLPSLSNPKQPSRRHTTPNLPSLLSDDVLVDPLVTDHDDSDDGSAFSSDQNVFPPEDEPEAPVSMREGEEEQEQEQTTPALKTVHMRNKSSIAWQRLQRKAASSSSSPPSSFINNNSNLDHSSLKNSNTTHHSNETATTKPNNKAESRNKIRFSTPPRSRSPTTSRLASAWKRSAKAQNQSGQQQRGRPVPNPQSPGLHRRTTSSQRIVNHNNKNNSLVGHVTRRQSSTPNIQQMERPPSPLNTRNGFHARRPNLSPTSRTRESSLQGRRHRVGGEE